MSNEIKTFTQPRFLLPVACFVVAIWGLSQSQAIVVPVLLAIFVAILSTPPLLWLKQKGLPAWAAFLVVLLTVVIAGGLVGTLVNSQVQAFLIDKDRYAGVLADKLDGLFNYLAEMGMGTPKSIIGNQLNAETISGLAVKALSALTGVITDAFFIFITVLFILGEASTFSGKLQAAVGRGQKTLEPFQEFFGSVNRYLAIKTGTSILTGIVVWIFLAVVGVKFAPLWGLISFLLNYIPTLGSILAAIPPVMLALVDISLGGAIGVAVGQAVINLGIGNVLEPRLMGKELGLSALVIFISLAFWGSVLGIGGALLSVPLTVAVKIALNAREDTRWLAILMGSHAGAGKKVAVPSGGDNGG